MLNTKMRTRTFMRGMVTIDMKKLDETLTVIVYAGLYIVNKLLLLACMISCIMIAAAGGDGKYSDGNVIATLLFLCAAIICGLAAKFTNIMMNNIVKTIKKNRTRD